MIKEKCILMKKKKKTCVLFFFFSFLDLNSHSLNGPEKKVKVLEEIVSMINVRYATSSAIFLHLYTRLRNFRYAFVTSMYIN